MSVLDTLKNLVGQNPDKARKGLKKATAFVDERTGGKYRDKLDKVHDKAEDFIDNSGDQEDDQGGNRGTGEQPGPTDGGRRQ